MPDANTTQLQPSVAALTNDLSGNLWNALNWLRHAQDAVRYLESDFYLDPIERAAVALITRRDGSAAGQFQELCDSLARSDAILTQLTEAVADALGPEEPA